MIRDRRAVNTRLCVEQLESRALLAADPFAAADLLPSNPQGSSDMSGGGFPGQVSVVAAASLGFTNATGQCPGQTPIRRAWTRTMPLRPCPSEPRLQRPAWDR